jgi:hypothetical protein
MKAKGNRIQFTALVVALVALAAIWIERPASRVLAIQDSEDKPSPLGVAFGQSLFLNVANTGARNPIPVQMLIVDEAGNTLVGARRLVLPGHTETLSLNRNDLSDHPERRLITRAVVNSLGGPDTRSLVVSQEVVDNETAKTTVLHPGISKGFNPQPDPPSTR